MSNPLSPIQLSERGSYAGFWWRVLAWIIDYLVQVLLIVLVVFVVVFVTVFIIIFVSILFKIPIPASALSLTSIRAWSDAFGFFTGIVIDWLYYALMESSATQATLGKMVCGLRVTSSDGKRLSFLRATGRHYSKLLSSLTTVGYLMPLWTLRKQSLHDKVSRTVVLRMRDAKRLPVTQDEVSSQLHSL